MPTLYHVKINMAAKSGDTKDDCSMSWSFISTADSSGYASVDVAQGAVDSWNTVFLNGAGPAGLKVASVLGPSLSRSANQVTASVYGPLTGAKLGGSVKGDASTFLGSPLYEELYTIGTTAPAEEFSRQTALDLVLRATGWEYAPFETSDGSDANALVDRPRQRLTGRIKLGPIGVFYSLTDAQGINRPTATLVAMILDRANAWRDDMHNSIYENQLAVWSRANKSMVPVTDVQVPNAWSNVIRRKGAVTVRNTTAVD